MLMIDCNQAVVDDYGSLQSRKADFYFDMLLLELECITCVISSLAIFGRGHYMICLDFCQNLQGTYKTE